MAKYANILETIGTTPVVKVGKLAPTGVDLCAISHAQPKPALPR